VSVSVLVIANRSGGARGGDEGERESGMRALRTAREREREPCFSMPIHAERTLHRCWMPEYNTRRRYEAGGD